MRAPNSKLSSDELYILLLASVFKPAFGSPEVEGTGSNTTGLYTHLIFISSLLGVFEVLSLGLVTLDGKPLSSSDDESVEEPALDDELSFWR